MRLPRPITLTVGALAAVLCAAGCSTSGSSTSSSSSPKSSAVGSATTSSSAPLTQNSLPPASAIVNNVEKRKSITIAKCVAADGGWAASGTAANPGAADATYAITVFFTDDHATVEDFATATVTVKPGQTVPWSATKKFAASTPTNCVLRGVG